jgi:hypothetical protein
VTAYRFLTDYKAVAAVSLSSILSIIRAYWRLPPIPKPSPGSPHVPSISERKKRRLIIRIAVVTIILTLVTLWLHFIIPSEIGHITTPPIDIESFRPQLDWFLSSFALLVLLQAGYWILLTRISRRDQK